MSPRPMSPRAMSPRPMSPQHAAALGVNADDAAKTSMQRPELDTFLDGLEQATLEARTLEHVRRLDRRRWSHDICLTRSVSLRSNSLSENVAAHIKEL